MQPSVDQAERLKAVLAVGVAAVGIDERRAEIHAGGIGQRQTMLAPVGGVLVRVERDPHDLMWQQKVARARFCSNGKSVCGLKAAFPEHSGRFRVEAPRPHPPYPACRGSQSAMPGKAISSAVPAPSISM
jgi:hypothetical protein